MPEDPVFTGSFCVIIVGTIGDGSDGPRTKDHRNRPQWSQGPARGKLRNEKEQITCGNAHPDACDRMRTFLNKP